MDLSMILGIHRIIVTAFLFFFLFKTVLLITKKTELLDSVRKKTKVIDMILGTLIIVTGVYLMIITKNHSMWINMKAIVILAVIPLGIISMKKSNVILAILVNVLLIGAYGIGEAKPWNKKEETEKTELIEEKITSKEVSQVIMEQNTAVVSVNAKAIFVEKCTLCHGIDGKKGNLGATDLSQSTISIQEKIEIITNGKGAMIGMKNELSSEEIESLAMYLTMLK